MCCKTLCTYTISSIGECVVYTWNHTLLLNWAKSSRTSIERFKNWRNHAQTRTLRTSKQILKVRIDDLEVLFKGWFFKKKRCAGIHELILYINSRSLCVRDTTILHFNSPAEPGCCIFYGRTGLCYILALRVVVAESHTPARS